MKQLNTLTIEQVVERFMKTFSNRMRTTGHNATGNLSHNQSYQINWDGNIFEVSLYYEDYLQYLEYGTRPHFPPVDKIREWVRIKRIMPRDDKMRKLPRETQIKQLAYLFGRKISRVGTPATKILTNTLNDFNLVGRIYAEFLKIYSDKAEKQIKETL